MKVYDCGDYYFFGNCQKREVENILEGELGIKQVVKEITWEEYDWAKGWCDRDMSIALKTRASEEMGCTCDACLDIIRNEGV